MNFNISNLLLKNNDNLVALVGFMGVGKSSIGKGLSKKLNFIHIDTDFEIEKKKNMKIKDIFEFYGENYFRELEQNIIIDIINQKKNSVISLGGGSFLNIKVREIIKKKCISIWLHTDINTIYSRMENTNNIRPLFSKIKNKPDLEVLLKKRSLIYQEADIKINTKDYKKNYLINKIFRKLKYGEE